MTDTVRMSKDELRELVKEAVSEALLEIGIRADGHDNVELARKDFLFLRSIRETFSSAAGKVGSAVLLGVVGGFMWAVWWGIQFAVTAKTGAPPR